jgi:exonuclease SbcD
MIEIAVSSEVDLIVVAGDLFDASSPTPLSEEIVWRALMDLAEVSPVVVVAGNHDSAPRLDAVAPLLEMGRVTAVGTPRSPNDGGTIELEDIGVKLGLLPFVSQRGIVKAEDIMGSDPDQHAGLFEDRLRRIVESLTRDMTAETVNVLVSHLTVYGALAGGGERQAHIFGYAVPSSLFPGHLSYVALGHLHRQQKMPHSSAVWYSGSPLQLDFGEVADQKGVLLVEASPGLPAKVTAVPLSEGRRLKTIRGTLDEVLARSDDVTNDYVKVVLVERARVGLSDEVRAAIPEVVEVVLESTEPARRESESRQKLKPTEAFHRYLTEKGVEDPLMEALFAELLDEAAI